MKKLFIIILLIGFMFISCDKEYINTPIVSESNETITIKAGFSDFNYKKIIIENHEYYFRYWCTKMERGSDLIHNPNCSTCKNDSI